MNRNIDLSCLSSRALCHGYFCFRLIKVFNVVVVFHSQHLGSRIVARALESSIPPTTNSSENNTLKWV